MASVRHPEPVGPQSRPGLEVAEALDVAAGTGRDRIDLLELALQRFAVMAGLGYGAAMRRLVPGRLESSLRTLTMRGRTVSVRAAQALPVEYDGDYGGEIRQLSVAALPGAVELCTS